MNKIIKGTILSVILWITVTNLQSIVITPITTPATTSTVTPVTTTPATTPTVTPVTTTPATTPTVTPTTTITPTVTLPTITPPSTTPTITPPTVTPLTTVTPAKSSTAETPGLITQDKKAEGTTTTPSVTTPIAPSVTTSVTPSVTTEEKHEKEQDGVILLKSPYTYDATKHKDQINANAPVVTIKTKGTFIFNGPSGSVMHPTDKDLQTKLEADKKADSKITETIISTNINGTSLTVTGKRASMAKEEPYPIIIEEMVDGKKKYTTIARVRVVAE